MVNKTMTEVLNHHKEVEKHFSHKRAWATMLYGSQNYNLSTSESDVDTKSMILPSTADVVLGRKMVSTELKMIDGSLAVAKDYRDMFKNYLKGNINFVEMLYTPYYVVGNGFEQYSSYMEELRSSRDLIANCQPRKLMHMATGMARQKYVAMEKPFAGKLDVLAEWGYDPKQLHHMVRLLYFMRTFYETINFESALVPHDYERSYLLGLKLKPVPLKQARDLAESTMEYIDNYVRLADENLPEDNGYQDAKSYLDDLAVRMFKDLCS